MNTFVDEYRALTRHQVRFVVIGVWGANYYACSASMILMTRELEVLLPEDAHNLELARSACQSVGRTLRSGSAPLGPPTFELSEAVVARRASTTAVGDTGAAFILTTTMPGFSFADVDAAKVCFMVEDVIVPVARLAHIVESMSLAGSTEDQLFLTLHCEVHDLRLPRSGVSMDRHESR